MFGLSFDRSLAISMLCSLGLDAAMNFCSGVLTAVKTCTRSRLCYFLACKRLLFSLNVEAK